MPHPVSYVAKYGETTTCVCVCVCLRAKGKTILFHRRGVGRQDGHTFTKTWCVCVCVSMAKGKTILFHRRVGAGSPSSLARTHSWKTTKPQGWGEGMPQEAEHKTAAVGEGDAAEAEGISCSTGGAGRINHELIEVQEHITDAMRGGEEGRGSGGRGGGGEGGGGPPGRNHIFFCFMSLSLSLSLSR